MKPFWTPIYNLNYNQFQGISSSTCHKLYTLSFSLTLPMIPNTFSHLVGVFFVEFMQRDKHFMREYLQKVFDKCA